MQQRRASPTSQPSPPPSIASRATSDPGPPPTPAPSPPPPPPGRARRASKRQSEANSPNPLYSGQTKDRRLGRSSAKIRRSPTPPPAEEAQEHAAPPPADTGYASPAEMTEAPPVDATPAKCEQEVLLINHLGFKAGKTKGQEKRRNPPARSQRNNGNEVYFRCREDIDLPAANRARTAFIPIELYFRDCPLTAEELRRACVDDRKVISLYWNFSFETRRKAKGVTQWFQHDRRRDSGFPFNPGPAARLHIPKNVHVQVRAGCRLGVVVAVVNAGLDRLQGENEASFPASEPTLRPPPSQTTQHTRQISAGPGAFPGPCSTSPSSASFSL